MKTTNAIYGVFSFMYNLPHDFIERTWAGDQRMIDHFRSKFSGFCSDEGYASANAILRFVGSLSDDNQQKLFVFIKMWIEASKAKADILRA